MSTTQKTILIGHISPETAYLVEDYPYGFRLRCKIRYWLEFKEGFGARLVSQTTNPKRSGEVWNKPKYSTYARFGACMYLDSDGHVQWSGLTEYCDGAKAALWREEYGRGVPEAMRHSMNFWVETKLEYDRRKAEGGQWNDRTMTAECTKIGKQRADEIENKMALSE